jgi:hypothetical protein
MLVAPVLVMVPVHMYVQGEPPPLPPSESLDDPESPLPLPATHLPCEQASPELQVPFA